MNNSETNPPLGGGMAHHLPQDKSALREFHRNIKQKILDAPSNGTAITGSHAVAAFGKLIESDAILRMYVEQMFVQVNALPGAPEATITTIPELLAALNLVAATAPLYNADPKKRNAFPMSSLFGYMMMTGAGEALFRHRTFNAGIQAILQEWCAFLDSEDSTSVLNDSPTGWLSQAAYKEFQLKEFEIDPSKPAGGFDSYNAFFHRQIIPSYRPVSNPDDPNVIVSANDGNVVSIARGVQKSDRFWLKGEPFSLVDMLDRSGHTDLFVGGDVFQSFLSGANYHRWHAPVAGTVVEARVVDGLMFSDAESAGWDPSSDLSEGYYAAVNTRGLVFLQSDDPVVGMVCVIPIGITEISSVRFSVKAGDHVEKGDELGYFSYGGSSMCLVFQKGAVKSFDFSDDQLPAKPLTDPTLGPPVRVNKRIAVASANRS